MFNNDLEQKIIHAIQNQLMLEIRYRKISGERDSKIVAPYDLFPKTSRDGHKKDFLQGCSESHGELSGFSAYLDGIESVNVLSRNFSGEDVKRVLSYPNKQPYIERNW